MSRLTDAQKAVGKLEARASELRGRLAAAQADEVALQGQRAALEQAAYGQEDAEAERTLEKVEAAIGKCQARQRGIAAEIVAVTEQWTVACETLRAAQLAHDASRLREINARLAEIDKARGPLVLERQRIIVGSTFGTPAEDHARREEQEAVTAAREFAEGVRTEQHAGFRISTKISSEVPQ